MADLPRTSPSQRTTVAIIVLSWNRQARVLACVERLRRLPDVGQRIVVVDNASSDGSPDAVEASVPDAIVLRQPTNRGFVGGVNAGLVEAAARGFAYAWLLNDDTDFADDLLDRLLRFADAHPSHGLFSPVVRDTHAPHRLQFRNGIVDWKTTRLYDEAPDALFDRVLAAGGTPALIGTALLVRLEAVAAMGRGLDERYFAYWEDIDVSVRAARAGWPALLASDLTVYHDSPDPRDRPPHYYYYMVRNEALFWSRHAASRRWMREWSIKSLIRAGECRDRGQADALAACVDGIWDGLNGVEGRRDPAKAAPDWFAAVVRGKPHFLVMLLRGDWRAMLRRLAPSR